MGEQMCKAEHQRLRVCRTQGGCVCSVSLTSEWLSGCIVELCIPLTVRACIFMQLQTSRQGCAMGWAP